MIYEYDDDDDDDDYYEVWQLDVRAAREREREREEDRLSTNASSLVSLLFSSLLFTSQLLLFRSPDP